METLQLCVLTWNVATRLPESDMKSLLGICEGAVPEKLPDFYAIGLQEVKAQPQNIIMDAFFEDPWTNAFRTVLSSYDFVKAKTIRMQGLVLTLFSKRKHLVHIRDLETQYTKTGLGGMWGNKGAVSIRLNIYGCSLCLLNCHLAPHDHALNERIAAYNSVLTQQVFQDSQTTHILFHDYVFWFGDLNFRLTEADGTTTPEEINELVKKNKLSTLVQKDQLKQVMMSGEAFSELTESPITFPPTYKFNGGASDYDLKRRPAWPDRILYKVNADVYDNVTLQVTPKEYKSHPEYVESDHRPVTADFLIKVFSSYYERMVEFHPIPVWYANEEGIVSYTISRDVTPTPSDWLGLFKADFSSLDDYLSYIYVPRTQNVEDSENLTERTCHQTMTFNDDLVRYPGMYVLIYFNHNSSSVLGMSDPFPIQLRDDSPVQQRIT